MQYITCILTAYFISTVRIFDLRKISSHGMSTPLIEVAGHRRSVSSAYFSPITGNYLLTTSYDDHLRYCSFLSLRVLISYSLAALTSIGKLKKMLFLEKIGIFASPYPYTLTFFNFYHAQIARYEGLTFTIGFERVFDTSNIVAEKITMKSCCRHNNNTGRWLSSFRATWHPARDDALVVGCMLNPRQVEYLFKLLFCYMLIKLLLRFLFFIDTI